MSGLASSLPISASLFVLLLVLWRKAAASAREMSPQGDIQQNDEAAAREACPAETVSKIFSREDQEFVSGLQCASIERLFRAERKSLALLWVQQTTQAIQGIIREHTQLTRRTPDLEFRTEMKVLFRYAELRIVCGFLFLSIELGGPFWMRGLAMHASNMSQRIGQSHEALLATTQPEAVRSVDSY